MNNPSTCPHFPACSGCELIDIYNPPLWQEGREYFRQHEIEPEWITGGFSQTRYKAKLAVRAGPKIGLFKKGTHEVLSIPHCLVHHASINRAVARIQEEMIRHSIRPYEENPPSGTLRYVQLFVERATGKIQLALVATQELSSFCAALLKYDLWHSIWLNIHPRATNQVLGDTWVHIHGEPYLWQTLSDVPIPFHPGAFSQTHLPLFEQMIQKIASWIPPDQRILELYAGVGAIGLVLQPTARHITLVENNPYAHLSYQQTPKSNLTFLPIDAKEAPFSDFDFTIVDPPRKGLDPEVLSKISSKSLIYISCGFSSFKRDSEALIHRGYRLKKSGCYLLFPGTNHIETLALFERT